MKRIGFLICVVLITVLFACKEPSVLRLEKDGKELEVSLVQESDSSYLIRMMVDGKVHNEWALPYPVYRFDYGDVTGNGVPDIAVGVSKTTRFDPKLDKRLFLFRITDDYYIRPLWLGSRVAQPLVDFRIVKEEEAVAIRTIEKEKSGNYLVAEYRWRSFGLEFKQYINRELSLQTAQKLLKNK